MKNSSWALCAAAVLTGVMGLQLMNVQTMATRVDFLSAQVTQLQEGMDQLTASAANVGQANDLLSNLIVQGQRSETARAAIEQMRRLEREVRSQGYAAGQSMNLVQNMRRLHEAIIADSEQLPELNAAVEDLSAYQQQVHGLASTATREFAGVDRATELVKHLGRLKQDVATQAANMETAVGGLQKLADLKQRVTNEGAQMERATAALGQLATFKQRVAAETDGLDIAETQLSRLVGLKKTIELINPQGIAAAIARVADFVELQNLLLEDGQVVETATDVSRQLLAMQDEIINRGGRVDVARKHADGLLSLEDALADDANLDINHAQANLEGLVALERQLASQDAQIVAAVEALELMSDLQTEFVDRIGTLEGLRTGLTELAMMESSIMRTVRALEPLVEITSLRRLNGSDLQAIARGLMDRRTARVATRDPHDLPAAEDFSAADRINANVPDELLVPIPPTRD